MKVLIIPGFWNIPENFSNLISYLNTMNNEVILLDYKKYYKAGFSPSSSTFSKMLDSYLYKLSSKDVIIGYSMGASYIYDYLKSGIPSNFPKIVFIDPIIGKSNNLLKTGYLRLKDISISERETFKPDINRWNLFKYIDIAIWQLLYNQKITLDLKLAIDVTFFWGEKDLVCPIKNYDSYKLFFKNTRLITVEGYYHAWILDKKALEQYLELTL